MQPYLFCKRLSATGLPPEVLISFLERQRDALRLRTSILVRNKPLRMKEQLMATPQTFQTNRAIPTANRAKRKPPAEHAKRVVSALGAGGMVMLVAAMGLTDRTSSTSGSNSSSSTVPSQGNTSTSADTNYLLDGYTDATDATDTYNSYDPYSTNGGYSYAPSAPTQNYYSAPPNGRSSGSG